MKRKRSKTIPIHQMANQSSSGIKFSYMDKKDQYQDFVQQSDKNVIHRDDYYVFLFLEKASAVFSVDFEEIELCEKDIFYIRPGQVHFSSTIGEIKGWSLAIDTMLVEKDYKNIFESQLSTQKPITLNATTQTKITQAAHLLRFIIQDTSAAFRDKMILSLANVFIGIMAQQYKHKEEQQEHNKSQSASIVHQFNKALSENFKIAKSPSQYANMLNYSLSHLNESVKKITGFPVSYWIQQQVVLEAKRLLYYTDMSVKEIAFSLGYEDHAYFSRLFSKIVGTAPSLFKSKIHE